MEDFNSYIKCQIAVEYHGCHWILPLEKCSKGKKRPIFCFDLKCSFSSKLQIFLSLLVVSSISSSIIYLIQIHKQQSSLQLIYQGLYAFQGTFSGTFVPFKTGTGLDSHLLCPSVGWRKSGAVRFRRKQKVSFNCWWCCDELYVLNHCFNCFHIQINLFVLH